MQIVLTLLVLFASGVVRAWAVDVNSIHINPTTGGSITVNSVEEQTGGDYKVTITASINEGYEIKKKDFVVEPVTDPSQSRQRQAPGIAATLEVEDGTSANEFYFILPARYSGAIVTANFSSLTPIDISDLSGITNPSGNYRFTSGFSASGTPADNIGSATNPFKGKIDGNFVEISLGNDPLFNTVDGANVKNVIISSASTTTNGHAGAIACVAKGDTRIYNCGILSGTISGSGYVGGIVGFLDGNSRVINCYSYANIAAGGTDKGGIVGYNNYASKHNDIRTMVMNCMFYGTIATGGNVSPVYGGENIDNLKVSDTELGLNTYNYYRYESNKKNITSGKYNCALAAKEKYLVHFELYRQLLNSNRKLAAWYAVNDASKGVGENNEMAKWVLDRSIAPYPILKKQGYYSSVINYDPEKYYDASGTEVQRSTVTERNKGKILGELTINVSAGSHGSLKSGKSQIKLKRIDKDFDNYNYNYDKVQLPYYNEVGNGNYTDGMVVTGWKVTVSGGSNSYSSSGSDVTYDSNGKVTQTPYNFADRNCTGKDNYSTSTRVFSQGAYFDVPYGVNEISIEAYWGKAAYICDKYYDVVYTTEYNGGKDVIDMGMQGNNLLPGGQTIYTSITGNTGALASLTGITNPTVYDYALVLVGNLHLNSVPSNGDKPFTIMSADFDNDNEPDYSLIYTHPGRSNGAVSPIRFDFINVPGMAMAQKPNGATKFLNVSIFKPKGWFEVTNTCLITVTQFEYDNGGKASATTSAPVILLGGEYEQFVSTQSTNICADGYKDRTSYIHIGSNAWFKEFNNGTHSDGYYATKHIPVSVTGGYYEKFYLSGAYRPDAQVAEDDAEGYISGGKFDEVAGAGQQQIDGNVYWQIYDADITDFYGGGVNYDKPITGNITVDIFNSHVTTYCGGPKFGDMQKKGTVTIKQAGDPSSREKNIDKDRIVTTNATGCVFGDYFGAGYGGISFVRRRTQDATAYDFSTWVSQYTNNKGKYFDGTTTRIGDTSKGEKAGPGVAVDFDYEFFVWSTGETGGRFYIKYASLSFAKTNDVNSTLNDCHITHNFYGGGHLGKVDGNVTSALNGCTIDGEVFGAGYSANRPTVPYRNGGFTVDGVPDIDTNAGVFADGEKVAITDDDYLTLEPGKTLTNNKNALGSGTMYTNYTEAQLNSLGTVAGKVTLTIDNYAINSTTTKETTITGNVYGGGESSDVYGVNSSSVVTSEVEINVKGGSMADVYGGGKGQTTIVGGDVTVNIGKQEGTTYKGDATITGSVYGGSALGTVNAKKDDDWDKETNPDDLLAIDGKETKVNILKGTVNGSVFGGGLGDLATLGTGHTDIAAKVFGDVTVTVGVASSSAATTVPIIEGSVYGGSNVNGILEKAARLNVISGTIGTETTSGNNTVISGGNVHGGGYGQPTLVKGDVGVNIGVETNETPAAHYGFATIKGDVYGGSAKGNVNAQWVTDTSTDPATTSLQHKENTVTDVNLYGGTVNGDVYGGGLGDNTSGSEVAANVYGPVTVGIYGGTARNVFGCNNHYGSPQDNVIVNIAGGTVNNNVFGGGQEADALGQITVNVTGGTVTNDVYGGGALADTNTANWDAANSKFLFFEVTGLTVGTSPVTGYYTKTGDVYTLITASDAKAENGKTYYSHYTTTVNLTGGTIGNAYGGALGSTEKAANVWGDVYLTVDGTAFTISNDSYTEGTGDNVTTVQVPKSGRVFGCNNINGTPKREVTVHVKQTVPSGGGDHTLGAYEIAAVYGGGNLAPYEPKKAETESTVDGDDFSSDDTKASTNVIIDGCGDTSIGTVYGGGNAASTPSTKVTVNGAYEIGELFGGGNGKDKIKNGDEWKDNPGAHVGFKAYTTESEKDGKKYGSGQARVNIYGGKIHAVYGGSNTLGNVRRVAVAMLDEVVSTCPIAVDEAYGGGKSADMDGKAILNLGCIPGLKNVYGGARAATVNNNVVLNITNGTYENVFGGNNESGNINGSITVNVEETGCRPVHITNLYGGGNKAPYPGATSTLAADSENRKITVNVKSCTSIGNIFGGGLGDNAIVTGNTEVNINQIKGKFSKTSDGYAQNTYGDEEVEGLGTIGNVYGGGSQGKVVGNTSVNIGTVPTVTYVTGTNTTTAQNVQGVNITGSVYGGGLSADVEGNSVVKIGTATLAEGAIGVNIAKDVFGGGEGKTTNVSGNVTVEVGKDNGDQTFSGNATIGTNTYAGSVYGGSALGSVNTAASGNNAASGTVIVNLHKGTVKGAVYGGGMGEASVGENPGTEAKVFGDATVTLYGDVVTGGLYGGCNLNGTMYGNTVLNLYGGTVGAVLSAGASAPDMVFGGGLGKDTKVNGNVTVNIGDADNVGSTIYSNVYGGSAKGIVNSSATNTTTVNLFKGIVYGDVFGGGLGDADNAAEVKGKVVVNLNDNNGTCVVAGSIFGCNNTNGSPKDDVEVHIYNTVHLDGNSVVTNPPATGAYELQAVYGGGKSAEYSASGKTTKVIIETCDVSIKEVYGGGYGADVPATNVEVKGAYEIGTVFGGGYGAGNDDPAAADYNPGANVNGITTVLLEGGTIHEAYGGSNTKGDVTGGTNVNVSDNGNTSCPLKVEQIYGGGKNAQMTGGTNIILGCQPDDWIEEIYAGAQAADVGGSVGLTITSGKFERVFGGNKTSGKIKGSITVNIEETGTCATPIIIGELYGGGYQAGYSIYGYNNDNTPRTKAQYDTWYASLSAEDKAKPENQPYKNPQLNVRSFTSIGAIYGGGYEALMVADPTVSINVVKGSHADDNDLAAGSTQPNSLPYPAHKKGAIGTIGNVFGGGNLATVDGSATVNIGTEETVKLTSIVDDPNTTDVDESLPTVEGANITGNVYGGGNQADITGNTQVNICAKYNETAGKWESASYTGGLAGVTIGVDGINDSDHGNVFGGGKGIADSFTCEKAMVGKDGDGETNPDGGTAVNIGNGTIQGNVYGGGEIGRVEKNTVVTIGIESDNASSPEIKGSVFGGGKGLETHGYAALVRGNPTVTIQGKAKIGHNVYGGGEIASVARYKVATTAEEAAAHGVSIDMPYVLQNANSGKCTVIVRDNAEIGPNDMQMTKADGPDDMGHVFGAGKGIMPTIYTYTDNNNKPKRMILNEDKTASIWEYFASEDKYIEFIQTLALATETNVTISGEAFVKGSVYGGSENGLVQYDTKVTIEGNCQIGNGEGKTERYTTTQWENENPDDFTECAHWEYGLDTNGDGKKDLFAPYDPNANATGDYLDKYPPIAGQTEGKSTEGGRRVASDGHTFYGNVFGGGSGSVPYFDTKEGISKYLPSAGLVKGNTYVYINGGHILTNVYGGNEATNVLGTANVTMTGGTIGVPRTAQQIKDHPVTCYLFGAGKGDQRIFFNKETNVNDAIVKVEGGRIFGSVFGGGEDGHVLRNTTVTIGKADGTGPNIGTVGSTYVDGNVFGGGRGFGGEALTAGNVSGSVDLTINGGTMLGSIYGGGRLASVGYGLYLTTEKGFGANNDDGYGKMQDDGYSDWTKGEDGQYTRTEISGFKRGYITVTVNGGTIGKEFADDAEGEHSGNVFGGSMGRLTKLDGTPFDDPKHWPLLATAKSTTVNINGGTIKRSVYGGGEMGTVTTDAIVNVSGGTIGTLGKGRAEFGNVYGGGKGYVDDAGTYATAGIIKGNTKVTINSGTNGEPKIYHNIYGGGAYGSVGTITYGAATYVPNQTAAVSNMPTAWERAAEGTTQVNTGTAEVYVYGGTIGTNGNENGMVFGSSRGDVGTPVNGIDPNNRLAWVYNTKVVIGGEGKSPIVYGSVYGSGENGHVFENTQVDIHSGTMGVTTDDSFGGPNYRLRGNVYGGGCGEDTYPGTTGTKKEDFNPLAGIVLGSTNVTIDGGQVVHNVYGAGALGSATNTSVTIAGNAVIGVSGKNGGNVFGAARGKEGITIVGSNLANSIETAVNINGGQIWGSVYGGGETGNVKQDVNVSMTGGSVAKDVYGGGALAHTQTANWDMTNSTWADATNTSAKYKTNVTVSGGTMRDVYGGGLGRVRVAAVAAQGTEGDPDYVPAVAEVTPIEAKVYGDVTVKLNEGVATDAKGAIVNRVFAANNLNGSPQGNTSVYVYATQSADAGHATVGSKFAKHTGLEAEGATSTYDVQAVYGGGNEAAYIPVSPYTAVNATGAKSQVVIEGCDLTSIKTVYGGGNAASVPETNVTVKSVYEIEDLFGGGNGKDDTSYGKNPGADIGVYKNASNEDVLYGTGNVNATTQGGYIHEIFGASNQKGNIKGDVALNMTQVGDCTLKIDKVYNAGRNADIEGNLISVLSCQPATKIQEYYGGAENANVKGNVELTITNGWFEKVFAGNNQSGAILGHIKLNVEETGCSPIRIDELYGCGNDAAYSIYGYYVQTEQTEAGTGSGDVGETPLIINEKLMLSPRTSADDPHKPVKTFNHEAQTWTVYTGGNSDPFPLYDNPEVNIVSATYIGKVFGGGYGAHGTVYGDPHVNINMIKGDWAGKTYGTISVPNQLGEIGVVYGGGNEADVVGNTFVNVGTVDKVKLHLSWDNTTYTWSDEKTVEGANITGNVFGGGKGIADSFTCAKAMIGKDGDGIDHPEGGTHVTIGNGTVMGNVYGGGEIGRVEKNTVVTIGLADVGSGESAPVIKGNVFGGGMGKETHGYAALVRGNPTVTIQADAKVEHNVYGGGQIASVARYNVPRTEGEVEDAIAQGYDAHLGMPYALANTTSGNCHVTVKDNAIIGPDTPMKMYHSEITDGSDEPDDAGHVFGAGKGILPENYTYVDKEHKPKRMVLRDETIHTDAKKGIDWEYVDPSDDNNKNVWEYFADRDAYIIFIQTLALSSYANVTIGDDTSKPFVKGSVYGGSENGLVQFDTKVYIKSGQIGWGKYAQDNAQGAYGDDVWADNYTPLETIDLECPHWDYGLDTNGDNKKDLFAPYDPYANAEGVGDVGKYPVVAGQTVGKSTEGGRKIASDGHTYYGNVFGGGSGSVPYFDTTEGISKYLNSAGTVKGDTYVEISGGHILTNVYGGCEATNVLGKATVKMTNGTIGVPRTAQQIKDHPVTCYLFGAGKGDQRIYFNKETNVNDAIVNVEGGRIYGSVFGGGEDGHVLRNTTVTIGKTDGTGPKIGTVGSTYVDGNVFGGGRGFGGEALTAGNVGGSVDLIINGGTMLGSVYGGGRLASVGYGLYLVNEEVGGVKPYGKMREDNEYDGSYPDPSPEAASAFYTKGRGHITVNINGGTIGSDVEDEHSGNVFGGSMGRLTKLDGTPFDKANHWALLATAKTTEVKIAGGTIKRNVYGGGEMGTVTKDATVTISGGTIGKAGSDNVEIGNVFGGGKGYLDPAQTYVGAGIVKGNTNVAIQNGTSGSTTTTPTIYQNVYGGGELGYVGMFTTPDHKEYTWTENTGLCTVGVAGGMITGHVFGAGKGHDDTFECERAMVRTTSVAVSDGTVGGNVYGGGEVGRVDQNSAVTIGPATGDSAPTITGSVFGAGAGVETHGYSALVRGNTAVVVQGNAKVGNSVYGGGQIAAVGRYGLDGSGMPSTLVSGGECVVTVQGNAVIGANGIGNVFGAGMGVDESKKTYTYADNANRPKRMMTYASGLYTDANKALWEFSDATHTYVWEYFDTKTKYLNFLQTLALATDTRLTINGNASVKGSVYGGSESGFVQRDTEVKILGGEILTVKDAAGNITEGNVFGGGKGISDNDAAGRVRSDTRITVLDGTINGDVYGGGALGKANTLSATNTTIVNLLGGTINGDVYGGGLGNATTAADVGNTKVNLNGMTTEELNSFSDDFKTLLTTTLTGLKEFTKKGAVVKGNVFGANNVNGTPKGHVLVHVHGTQNENTTAINAKVDGKYDVTGVYGGGKSSDYVPDANDTKQSTEVIIEGCDLTSIYEVYGGGYGAATPATDVLIKGTKIIENVFGGGYGASTAGFTNPGANIGYHTDKSKYDLGTGKALVRLMAGTIKNVYGASNTLGDIRGGSNVTNVANDGSAGCCDKLTVGEIYGGGKQADMFGGAEIILGCMPDDWIGAIYAGAENAKVGGDVGLTLTSGKFERVFGGNKSGGVIDGYIEVNIEENPECGTPIIIGELYGGGNEAAYTIPEKYGANYLSPRVNVRAFTSIGTIFGGGLGKTATVTGNPWVNINEVAGGREYAGETRTLEDGTKVTLYERKADGKMGVIGTVFGGGNAAPVIGNPRVEIGTAAKQKMLSLQTKDADGKVIEVEKDVLGADIRGNVYGGGNNAAVTGDPKVVIGQRKE
jgi:hypothetical protein